MVATWDRLARSPMYRTFRTSTKVSWSAPAVAMAWPNRTGLSSWPPSSRHRQQRYFLTAEQALHVAGGNIRRSFHLALGLAESALCFRAHMLLIIKSIAVLCRTLTHSARPALGN